MIKRRLNSMHELQERINSKIESIDQIVKRTKTHPEYSEKIRDKNLRLIEKEAIKHSTEIELVNSNKKRYKLFRERVIENKKNIQDSLDYLSKNGIGIGTISCIGKKIEPDNKMKGFRISNVVFGGIYAPEPHEINFHIERLLENINNEKIHPVIRASEIHIEMVRIHPYEDGNGRAARMLSNFFLSKEGYPSYIIEKSEKKRYINNIKPAIKDRNNLRSSFLEQSFKDCIFTNYIAAKILQSCKDLEKILKEKREYKLTIMNSSKEEAIARSLCNKIKSYGKRINRTLISKQKDNEIMIKGNIGKRELSHFVSSYEKKYRIGFRYNLDILDDV